MGAPLHDHALVEDDDLVTVTDGGQAVGDDDAGDAPVADGLDRLVLRPGIEGAGRLVQNDDRGILGQDPGDLQALALAAGQVLAVFRDPAVIAARPLHDIVVDLGVAGRQDDFKILDRVIPHADVVGDGVLKQDDVLVHDRDRARKDTPGNVSDGLAVEEDLAAPGLVEAADELADGRLAAAAAAHDGNPASRLQGHGEVPDHRVRQAGIAKGDIPQLHLSGKFGVIDVVPDGLAPDIGIIRIFHDVLDALHLCAHLLDGLPRADQSRDRPHEGIEKALEDRDHTDGETAFHGKEDPQEEDGVIGGRADETWQDPKAHIHFKKFDVLRIDRCLVAGPLAEKSVLRAGGFDGLRHADAGQRRGGQLARVPHLDAHEVDPLRGHISGKQEIEKARRQADQGQDRAVADHEYQIKDHHDAVKGQRRHSLDQGSGNGGIGILPLQDIARHAL